jgi:hypothetical protein
MALTEVPIELSSTPGIVDNSNATAITIDSSENVGIGTSNPAVTLHVNSGSNGEILRVQGADAQLRIDNSTSNVMNINSSGSGDSLTLSTNDTERMRIDSSGNVGIGRTNPSSYVTDDNSLYVKGQIRVDGVTNTAALPSLTLNDTNSGLFAPAANEIAISTGAAERIRVDSSGDLQLSNATDNIIRTGSDSSRIRIFGGSTESISNGAALTLQGVSHSGGNYADLASATGGYINFRIGSSNAMRIDSSGNLLVGKTVNDTFNEGFVAKAAGGANITAASGTVLDLNRRTDDGDIAVFRKDNTTVGSIGTSGGDLIAGTGDTGLYFYDGADAVIPWNISTNSSRNGSIDLGASSHRFKDLYLSGGVYVGGTGSANYLHDYEEGTFSPQVWVGSTQQTLSRADAGYVKIGDYVFYQLAIILSGAVSGSGVVQIRNFPFSFGGFGPNSNGRASGSVSYTNASIMPIGLLGGVGTTVVDIYANSTAGTAGAMSTALQGSDLVSGWNMHFTIQTRIA